MKKMPMPSPKICPVCKSDEVFPFMGFSLGMRFECKKCGYVGVFVIEKERRAQRKR